MQSTTAEERHTIAGWVREEIAKNKNKPVSRSYRFQWYGSFSFEEEITHDSMSGYSIQRFGGFLLDLEGDTLDDEAYLQICRETGLIKDAVERLLELGRVDEAARETKQASDYEMLSIADLFVEAGQDAVAIRLMQERAWKMRDTRLLEWHTSSAIATATPTSRRVVSCSRYARSTNRSARVRRGRATLRDCVRKTAP